MDLDPSPPNLPPLPDYAVVVCGWADDQESVACFFDALDVGSGAELFSVTVTVEGDAVYQIARATPDGDIDMFTDLSGDRYGSNNSAFGVKTCVADEFKIVGERFFSTGECGPVVFSW